MRWEGLFADLEAQLAREDAAQMDAEVADRTRREQATTRLADRVRAHVGRTLVVHLDAGSSATGEVVDTGPDWVLLREGGRGQVLVPLSAVIGVSGLSRSVAPPAGVVLSRLRLGHALRAVARDRSSVRLQLAGGEVLTGTVDRVGADHLDLAEHPLGEQRRAGAVAAVRAVPFPALLAVRSD